MKLCDNTVLITGGASGIGLALAEAFHQRGNSVIVCGRNQQRLAELNNRLPAIATYHCDLSDVASLTQLAHTVVQHHPGLNLLINNAGIQCSFQLADEASHATIIQQEIATNLLAPLLLTDYLLPHFVQQAQAAVINITSALALVPKQSTPVYCATKAALRSFTQVLRYQLEGTSVAVFELVPALVATAMTQGRGRGKISPDTLARATLEAIATDKHEILIEKTKILYLLHRIFPTLARRLLRHA